MFERNFVHGEFHQMDAASMFGFEVFNRQGIRHHLGVESFSLIANNDAHALAVIAAATDVNQLASLQAIAVEHRVAEGFAKREFDVFLHSGDPVRCRDKAHEPLH